MNILVAGAGGFVGSNLVDALLREGHSVTGVDNYYTGRPANLEHLIDEPRFTFVRADISHPLNPELADKQWDRIYNLACPASPPHYQRDMVQTLLTSTHGIYNLLSLAEASGARLLQASTSEIYGDPAIHPQPETYWGNVNTMGPRSCYDEGKRVAESYCYSFSTQRGVETRIARIFNTFGPRMDPKDGRVVSNFIIAALSGAPIQIYGTGTQTRSFMFVDDLVSGLMALMESDVRTPVNIGNSQEFSMTAWAEIVNDEVAKFKGVTQHVPITYIEAAVDDPKQRNPNNLKALELLGWWPKTNVLEGLRKTIAYFANTI